MDRDWLLNHLSPGLLRLTLAIDGGDGNYTPQPSLRAQRSNPGLTLKTNKLCKMTVLASVCE
ncbi:MAG: hypothetical protein WCG04_01715 [Alphaproteobacteria bacterium]